MMARRRQPSAGAYPDLELVPAPQRRRGGRASDRPDPVVSGGTTDAGWMGWQMVYRDHVAVSDEAGRKT